MNCEQKENKVTLPQNSNYVRETLINLVYHLNQIVILLKSLPQCVSQSFLTYPTVIIFSLHLMLKQRRWKMVQLYAVLTMSQFDAYFIRRKQITSSASRLTGLTVVGSQLLVNGKPGSTLYIHSGLRNFITWL